MGILDWFRCCFRPKTIDEVDIETEIPTKKHADDEIRAMRILEFTTEDDTELEKAMEIEKQLGNDGSLTKISKGGVAFNVLVNSDNQVVSFSGRPKIPPIPLGKRSSSSMSRPMSSLRRPESSVGLSNEDKKSFSFITKHANSPTAKVDHAKEDLKRVKEVRAKKEEALQKSKEEKEKIHTEKQKRAEMRRQEMQQIDKEKAEKKQHQREEMKRKLDESMEGVIKVTEQSHIEKQKRAEERRLEMQQIDKEKAEKKQREREEKKKKYEESMKGVAKETQAPPIKWRYLPPKTLGSLPDVSI